MNKSLSRWQVNFYAGLAVTVPVILSLAICKWLFGTISTVTDILLFWLRYVPFVERGWIYRNGVDGEMFLGWSLVALLLALLLVTMIGRAARHYFGKKVLEFLDYALLQIPLLNKIYGAIKQVNEALATNKNSAFQQVVLVEFPREGLYSIGFITNENHAEVQAKTSADIVSVFVPTTPNPTSGFLVLVDKTKVTKLDMSVADGIKFIISLGSVSPVFNAGSIPTIHPANPPSQTFI